MANIADRLTALAEAAGLSENALAQKSGIALSTLRRRIRRPGDLTLGEVLALSETLGVAPESLFPATSQEVESQAAAS